MALEFTCVKPVHGCRGDSGTRWENGKGPKAGATKLASLAALKQISFELKGGKSLFSILNYTYEFT